MEGVLERYEGKSLFGGPTWKKYFFVLHEDILLMLDFPSKKQLLGQIHLKVTTFKASGGAVSRLGDEADCHNIDANEFLLDSGKLLQLRLRAPNIQEFNEWQNTFSQHIIECNRGRYDTFKVIEKENRRHRSINRYQSRIEKSGILSADRGLDQLRKRVLTPNLAVYE